MPSTNQNQRLRPFRDTLSTARISTADAFKICPGLTTAMWTSTLLLMAVPSLQVIFVTWASKFGDQTTWITVLLATIGAVLMGTASRISSNIQNLMQLRLRAHYNSEFSASVSKMTPAQSTDPTITTQVQAVRDAIPFNVAWQATSTITVVGSLISVILLAASIWSFNPLAAILVGFAMIPELLTYSLLAKKENALWRPQARVSRRSEYLQQIQDFPPSSTELAAATGSFGIPAEARRSYFEYARLWSVIPKAALRLTAVSTAGVALLTAAAFTLILVDPSNSPSAIPAAMLGIISGLAVTRGAGSAFGELMSSTPLVLAHRKLTDLLAANPPAVPIHGSFAIEINKVSYSYGPSHGVGDDTEDDTDAESAPEPASSPLVLHGVDLHIEPGSIVALIGNNGSGKTTLAKLVAGILSPSTGCISMIETNPRTDPLITASLRTAATSMVFQDFTRFEVTIKAFIDPSEQHSNAELVDGLKRARAWEFVCRLPEGINTQLGSQWGGIGLSGGQWQRLAIARTFLSGAPVWILDEPTASVDANAESEIYRDLLVARPQGTTVIVISHRPKTLRQMDRIFVLDQGHVIESGDYHELVAIGGHFARLADSSLE